MKCLILTGITYDIKIENVTAATNNAVFGGPYSAIFAGQVGGVCDAIKQSIQSKWSQLCSTGIVCSGRFLNEMANKLHFSVVLYSSSHKLIHCPHLRKPETFNTLMGVMDERIFGKRIEGTRVTLELALLKLKLNRDDWSELPVAGSELYQSTKAEVSHQLTQIMRISKVQGTECNFEFSGFAQDDDGAVAAFALLFFDPLKITLPSVVQQLQNGLAAIRSLKLTDKQIDGLDYVWTPKMKFATTQPNPALPEKTRSEQELNSLIKMFMHLGTRRCPLWNAIDKTEHTIVHHSPILINLICRITVDRTKLVMDLKATANLFTQCLEHGLTAERKNWQMLSSLDAVSQ
ncbi:hypothetical protein X801_10345, partial [Opisthorchis viverrini]